MWFLKFYSLKVEEDEQLLIEIIMQILANEKNLCLKVEYAPIEIAFHLNCQMSSKSINDIVFGFV